ncbi:MAG TPA: hypothetical protein PKN23_01795 [Candidatus Hydrogenedentes bacterium]|nr:hypothetical protein [Candidatus Hydrogenedentota bacterium]
MSTEQTRVERNSEARGHQGPWLGLEPYQEGDAGRFFGRSAEVSRLVEAVRDNLHTTVYGPSGAGKTSLLRAGVFPRMREETMIPVYLRFSHAESAPPYRDQVLAGVREALCAAQVEAEPVGENAEQCPETLWSWFHRHEFWDGRNRLAKPVLVLDQFEELFTLGAARSDAGSFITELGDLCSNTVPESLAAALSATGGRLGYPSDSQSYRVVLSLREDFLARLEEITVEWTVFRRNRVSVQPMTAEQALEAVLMPGKGIVDEAVARAIVTAVSGGDAAGKAGARPVTVEPPLLSLFCARLDHQRRQNGSDRISMEQVEGSRQDILQSFYSESMGSVSERTRQYVEDNLLTGSGYRCAKALDDVEQAGIPAAEVGELVRLRLLRHEYRDGLRWIEFSHDILTGLARESRDRRKATLALERQRAEMEELRRERDRQRLRARRAVGFSVFLMAAVAAVCAGVWYGFFKEHQRYYRSWKKVYGLPVGLRPLKMEEVRHRNVSFQMTTNGLWDIVWEGAFPSIADAPVKKMVAVNGRLRPTVEHGLTTYLWSYGESHEEDDASKTCFTSGSDTVRGAVGAEDLAKVCQWEFVTGEDGRPVHEVGKDRKGDIVWGLVYAPSKADDARADTSGLPEWKRRACVHFVDAKGYPQKQRKDLAEYIEITYDTDPEKEGLERLIEYRDSVGNRVAGVDGAWAREYTHDAEGREASLFSKKWSEQDGRYVNMIDRAGNSGMTFEYDDNGDVRRGVSVGVDGEPMPVVDGYSEVRYSYDRWGNVESGYYYRNGSPCFHRQGHHCIRRSYDEHGAVSSESYQGVDGAPVVVAGGFAEVRMEKDPDGNITRMAYFGPDGAPCLYADGSHGWKAEYDPEGNETVRTYFDKDGSPVNISSGYATSRQVWEGGRLKEWACFGTGGEPAVDNTTGTHRTCREYDSQGYQARETYYGPDGKPCLHKDGNHGWEAEYDSAGNETRKTFLGLDGSPVSLSDGYATVRSECDQNGNVVRRTYYGADGSRCLHKEGNHGWKALHNLQGNEVERTYFGLHGEPVSLGDRYATVRQEYDAEGKRVLLCTYYAPDGSPCLHREGNHGYRVKYDDSGREIERTFLNVEGEPVALANGYATSRVARDAQGRAIGFSYYDDKDLPVEDSSDGTHKWVIQRDALGNAVRITYYAPDGQPCLHKDGNHGRVFVYDHLGNELECTYLGVDGKPVALSGYATVRREYGPNGRVIRETYFNVDGKPCLNENGFHGMSMVYDDRGNKETTLIGLDGKPLALSDGLAIVRQEYGPNGKVTRETYFDTDGEPCLYEEGYHGVSAAYDDQGNETERTYLGLDGKPAALSDGYATVRKEYGAGDKVTRETWFGADGAPYLTKAGCHGVSLTYDDRGNEVERTYFGLDGKPCESHEECVQTEYSYDEEGESNESASQGLSDREMRVPFIAEVVDGGAAQKAGIKKCDLVMVYQDWSLSDLVDDPEMKKFESAMDGAVADEKRVVVWDGEEFKSFTLPAGMIGIRVMDRPMPSGEHRALWKAFLKWLDEVTADSDGEAAE